MTNNTVYISVPPGLNLSGDFPDITDSPIKALKARGYKPLPGANDVITCFVGNDVYMYAAMLTFSNRSVVIFFYDLIDIEYFLKTYAPIAPILELMQFL